MILLMFQLNENKSFFLEGTTDKQEQQDTDWHHARGNSNKTGKVNISSLFMEREEKFVLKFSQEIWLNWELTSKKFSFSASYEQQQQVTAQRKRWN